MSSINSSTLVELLRWRSVHQPDQEAYRFLINGEKEGPYLTYRELDRQARAIGALLQTYGACGERVLLLHPSGLDFILAFFGCLYAGAIAVPAYLPRKDGQFSRIPAIVEDSQATFVLTTEDLRSRVETWFAHKCDQLDLHVVAIGHLEGDLEKHWREPDLASHSLAFLQYTSGSTATPKGVMVSHGNLLHNLAIIQKNFEHSPESRGLSWLPLFHDMGLIGGILQPLFVGFPVILMSPSAFLQRPIRWLQAISKYRVTTSGGPNFGYELCVNRIPPEQRKTLDLSSWDVAFNGAEPVQPETLDKFATAFEPCGFRREAFYPCYGLAEATLFVSGGRKANPPIIRTFQEEALEYNRVIETSAGNEKTRTLVDCGQTQPDQIIEIVHPESLIRCSSAQVGEIWISGPSVTQGYWKRPEETESTFRAYLKDIDEEPVMSTSATLSINSVEGPFLRTGDLGFFKDGKLFIAGRLKDLIIIRGCNHYPEDIEWRVEHSHPLFRKECSAAFSANIAGEERLIIAAEIDPQYWDRRQKSAKKYTGVERRHEPDPDELENPKFLDVEKAVSKIRQVVAEHHELQVYAVFLLNPGTIPKTTSGKIRRYDCKIGFLNGSLNVRASSIMKTVDIGEDEGLLDWESLLDSSPEKRLWLLETYLQKLVAAVLKVDPSEIDWQKRLSSLGIDSLMAVELQHRLETSLGIALPITRFLRGASVADLAEEGLKQLRISSSSLEPTLIFTQDRKQFPLSYNQRAIWFLHQLAPESAAYNIPFALRIRSEVDIPALRRAFQSLVLRHPVLRTTYTMIDGKPVQRVHKHQTICFEEIDASTWDQDDIDRHLAENAHYHFDLENGSVLRVTLSTRSARDHILLLTMHHIATDFWSMLVLMDEFGALYQAEKSGTRMALPLLSVSYKDYIRWQGKALGGSEGEQLFAYWREQLSGELPVLNLPTDRPRPPVQTYQGASYTFKLSKKLTDELHALAQASEATLYMTLLAAFQVLLYRYTDQEDILVGSPVAGRSRPDFDGIIGYFVNPVVMRADLSGNPPFQAFLEQVCQTVLAALEHQDYPFQLLVERLKLKRDVSRSPIFQVMFVLQQPHRLEASAPFILREAGGRMNLRGLVLESMAIEGRAAQFDVTLSMVEWDGELTASLEYNTDLFDAATVRRMAGHFQTLLQGIVAHPEQRIAELPILTEAERHQLLVEWNDTKTDYPTDKCIHELFEAQVERTPDAVAVVLPAEHDEDQQLTYRELNARANQLAHYLRTLGVGPEVLVGLCVERSLEMIVGLLGILKAGGAYVPLDPSYPTERLNFMLEDAGVPVLLTQERLKAGLLEQQVRIVCLDTDWGVISQKSEKNSVNGVQPENLAYVIYTSGSTGKPKGVLISHRSIATHCRDIRRHYELDSLDRVLQFASCSFDTSLEQIFPTLITGAMLVLRGKDVWAPVDFCKKISDYGISVINIPPVYWQHLTQEWLKVPEPFQGNQLRLVIVGGDVMLPEVFNLWQQLPMNSVRLLNAYGPTEATITATTFEINHQASKHLSLSSIPIGRPLANRRIYILDIHGNPVPIGVPGELYIGGAGLARGYLNHPELTREKFIPDPFSDKPGARLYRTGDLARYVPDGNIEFLGRIDHQVKIRGFRIELGEIEVVLTEHPAVREAVVIAREDHPGDKRLVAYVVQNPKSETCPEQGRRIRDLKSDLHSFLQVKLPDYMVPSAFMILEALPLTPNGKIDRCGLPAPINLRPELEAAYVMPENEVEQVIAGLWQEMLQIEKVGIYDNFFELGGHSLLAVQMHSRLQEVFDQDLSIVDFFTYPSIRSLARHMSQKSNTQIFSQQIRYQTEDLSTRKTSMNRRRHLRQKHRSL